MGRVTAPSLPYVRPRPPRHRRQRIKLLFGIPKTAVSSLTGASITESRAADDEFRSELEPGANRSRCRSCGLIRETASPLIAAGLTTLASALWPIEIPPSSGQATSGTTSRIN